MEERKYLLVIEKEAQADGTTAYGGYFPDLPGCIAVGDSTEEVIALAQEALEMHLAGMLEDGDPIPEPSQSVYLSARLPRRTRKAA